jgi:hypothetical protein
MVGGQRRNFVVHAIENYFDVVIRNRDLIVGPLEKNRM